MRKLQKPCAFGSDRGVHEVWCWLFVPSPTRRREESASNMSLRALVSVVIPSFNRAYCIRKAVDSVLAQTHQDLEIIIVDDGSTDDTANVIHEAYGADPRVRYLYQNNQGVAPARNVGLREAKGDFIALLDSDDIWLPWKIEAQLQCLAAIPEAGMVWTDMDAFGPDGTVDEPRFLTKMYGAYRWFPSREDLFERWQPFSRINPELAAKLGDPRLYSGDIFSQMVLGNLVHTSTVLIRRERFEKVKAFNVALRHSGEDYDFHLRTCREGPVAYLDAPSILYQHGVEDQLTVIPAFRLEMARNFLATIEPVIEHDRDRIRLPQEMIDEVLAGAHAWIGECYSDRGDNRAARHELLASLLLKPTQPRTAAFFALSLLPGRVSLAAREKFRAAKRSVLRRKAA